MMDSHLTGQKATHKTSMCAQRARMHRLQHTMLLSVDLRHTSSRRLPPSEKDHATTPHPRNKIDRFLGEFLPSLVGVAIGLMRADGEASVEHENAAICPRHQETPIVRRRFEVGVAFLNSLVNIDKRRWRSSRRSHGER